MQIDRFYYPTQTLGFGNRISIWTVGCPRKCKGCSNPELQSSNPSKDIPIKDIIGAITGFNDVDGLTITGGEPFFQTEELYSLLAECRKIINGDILVFTGYTLESIKADVSMSKCLNFIDILIDGEYIEELNDNVGLRGSANQNIIILNEKYSGRYADAEKWPRKSQLVIGENTIVNIGIPIKAGSD